MKMETDDTNVVADEDKAEATAENAKFISSQRWRSPDVAVASFQLEKMTDFALLEPFLETCDYMHTSIKDPKQNMHVRIGFKRAEWYGGLKKLREFEIRGTTLLDFLVFGPDEIATITPRVYLKNLPTDVDEAKLTEMFPNAKGNRLLKFKGGESRGCAVITFAVHSFAEEAIKQHNGTTIGENVIEAELMKSKKQMRKDRLESSDGQQQTTDTKEVGNLVTHTRLSNLPTDVTADLLETLFPKAKKVTLRKFDAVVNSGVAFISFHCLEDAEEAAKDNDGTEMDGQNIVMKVLPRKVRAKPFPRGEPEVPWSQLVNPTVWVTPTPRTGQTGKQTVQKPSNAQTNGQTQNRPKAQKRKPALSGQQQGILKTPSPADMTAQMTSNMAEQMQKMQEAMATAMTTNIFNQIASQFNLDSPKLGMSGLSIGNQSEPVGTGQSPDEISKSKRRRLAKQQKQKAAALETTDAQGQNLVQAILMKAQQQVQQKTAVQPNQRKAQAQAKPAQRPSTTATAGFAKNKNTNTRVGQQTQQRSNAPARRGGGFGQRKFTNTSPGRFAGYKSGSTGGTGFKFGGGQQRSLGSFQSRIGSGFDDGFQQSSGFGQATGFGQRSGFGLPKTTSSSYGNYQTRPAIRDFGASVTYSAGSGMQQAQSSMMDTDRGMYSMYDNGSHSGYSQGSGGDYGSGSTSYGYQDYNLTSDY